MPNIFDVDVNFKVNTTIDKPDIRFYDVQDAPFALYGLLYEGGQFRRMPEPVAKQVNPGVHSLLHTNTAGGRVRFKTDSPYIAIHAETPVVTHMVHFPYTGSVGFDLYVRENGKDRYVRTFIPPMEECTAFDSIIEFDSSMGGDGMREFTVHFPLYSDVSKLYIGLHEQATVSEPTPYRIQKPIVYYGSSITQGGCASRPGNAYTNILSRRLDADHINLGFSGSAKGEDAVTEYIASLDMSLFVLDYDYNAPTPEHLKNTHERLFNGVRKQHPTLPVVMLSRPKCFPTDEDRERVEIIRTTYQNALKNGDNNVYFIEGSALLSLTDGEGTVDNTHPNDLGFYSMAKVLGDLLETLL